MEQKTLMKRLLDAGYPRENMFNHESDLYVYVNEISRPVVESYYKEHGWDRHWQAPIFRDQITGKPMYDCAFMYDDWLKDKEAEIESFALMMQERYGRRACK